jgi:hypothetical protein
VKKEDTGGTFDYIAVKEVVLNGKNMRKPGNS